ncbi:hypothetical protein BD410DRAFT_820615 [Rickenella mellea]|uniref:Cryptic loci regulator 2 N-terminal domain-containing protein n=1 Tax=Rickenella mellea TaxID=50990 RepID=A0A4Y7Q947_9AGAM|nr:hypothetical protein BD410DRAFT_820615 [Rickenella mellea]
MGRGLSSGHVIPPNPHWITFDRTDANSGKWPKNTEPNPDSGGHVNFMRPYAHDESGSVYWRCQIGAELAKKLNYPPGPSYVLKNWPAGYKMYDHNKGPQANPRHDPYLFGSVHVGKFRSAAEFIPHALWLLTDATLSRANCLCKYCSKTPQREVSDNLGLTQSRTRFTPSIAPSSRSQRDRASDHEPTRVYAAVRRVPEPVRQKDKAQLVQGPKQFIVPEREKDLRASLSSKGMKTKRIGREGELVWCAMDQPIAVDENSSPDDGIRFWPGLIQETRLKTEIVGKGKAKAQQAEDVHMDDTPLNTNPSSHLNGTSTAHSNGNKITSENDDDADVPWTVTHSVVYKIKLLAVLSDALVPDVRMLPYQAYAPSQRLIQAMQDVPMPADDEPYGGVDVEVVDVDTAMEVDGTNGAIPNEPKQSFMDRFAQFEPIPHAPHFEPPPKGVQDRFREAVGPFALAIQIASRIAGYWTPIEEWRLSLTFPTDPPPPSLTLTPASMAASTARTFNSRDPHVDQIFTQTRFQGLWWGSERIWMGELVRLKVGRHQLAPDGAGRIKKPAPPSTSTKQHDLEMRNGDSDIEEVTEPMGAASRGVFMKLEGLFVEDVPRTDGKGSVKECRICGMLYELADEDWADPDEPETTNARVVVPVDIKGKGKATDTGIRENGSSESLNLPPPPGTINPAMLMKSLDKISTAPPNPQLLLPTRQGLRPQNKPKPTVLSSPPPPSTHPLPSAPRGYKFRPILDAGHEAVVDLTLLSGRYYPDILAQPLLRMDVSQHLSGAHLQDGSALWALEGLVAGIHNAVDPTRWKPSRVGMVREADALAREDLIGFWRGQAHMRDNPPPAGDETMGDAAKIEII